jgi:hypothetical protein
MVKTIRLKDETWARMVEKAKKDGIITYGTQANAIVAHILDITGIEKLQTLEIQSDTVNEDKEWEKELDTIARMADNERKTNGGKLF